MGMTPRQRIGRVIEEQGWQDGAVLELLWMFIDTSGKNAEVAEFLEEIAKQENEHEAS